MKKVSNEMYPLNELREEFAHRIRTTGFTKSRPNVLVSFKLFSNIVRSIGNASEHYAIVIEKALSGLSFLTQDGVHHLNEVNYMFIDDKKRCTAVLNDGTVLTLMMPGQGVILTPITGDPVDNLIVSTYKLKAFYLKHREDFPYLNSLAEEINSMGIKHSMVSQNTSVVAQMCKNNEWIRCNIDYCIDELSNLLSQASFVLISKDK